MQAQLELGPAPQEPAPVMKSRSNARTKSHEPVSLPFWEDFSSLKPGYPDTAKWVNSTSVNISDGAGINPPSVNVAEFDGLDPGGTPYNVTETTLNGFTDTLTSVEIRMDEVLLAERNSVYLSFFYQWKGNGEPPDQNDFLQVEFKNDQDNWDIVSTIYGGEIDDPTIFNTALIQVSGDQFYHDAFQFRLRSYGRLSGRYDTWIVDYIYLNKGRSNSTPLSFPTGLLFPPFRLCLDSITGCLTLIFFFRRK